MYNWCHILKDEAVLVQKIVQEDRFVLVTSANHMPRSMALFRKLWMEPAPAKYFVKEKESGVGPRIFDLNFDGVANGL